MGVKLYVTSIAWFPLADAPTHELLNIQYQPQCTVRTFNSPHAFGLGAPYGLSSQLPASVQRTVVNACRRPINLIHLRPEELELKPQRL